ncbi:MAG: hypothetical protein AAB899_02125, partial [Patescibacteria group bacterium]
MAYRLQPKYPRTLVHTKTLLAMPILPETKSPPIPKHGLGKETPKILHICARCLATEYGEKGEENEKLFRFIDAPHVPAKLLLLEFVRWFTSPRSLRRTRGLPETQREWAVAMGVHQNTLTRWKQLPHFWDEVSFHRKDEFRRYTSDVYYALVKKALKEGGAREVELFHKLFESPNKTPQ